tara:strand:- start:4796 stop:7189 length:2394 start_codon:yes stop_codon:yes gene_type:complete
MKFATNWSKWMLTFAMLLLVPGLVMAQDEDPLPEFGDNRILFVDGPNLTTAQIDGSFVEDVVEAGNIVHRISGGAWFSNGYKFDGNGGTGFDFTQNMADVDTVYFRLRINPEDVDNADGSLRKTSYIVLADKSDGTKYDMSWGIRWKFPDDAYDNAWHEYAIPLPKTHIAAHDSALKGLDLDGNPLPADEMYNNDLQKQWEFYYAWNPEEFYSVDPNDSTLGADPEWDKFGRMYISLGNDISGAFHLDDVYIGSKAAVDLSVTASLPDTPEAVTATTVGDSVSVTWTHNAATNIFSYDVYYSGEPITSLEGGAANYLGSVKNMEELQLGHKVKSPHPGDATHDYYYALTPVTQFGIGDLGTFTTTSTAASGEIQPYIFELTPEQEAAILGDLDNGEITGAGWPVDDFDPFMLIGEDGWDDGGTYSGEMDGSAKIWVAFGRSDELTTMYMYVEAYDDDVYGGGASNPAGSWGTTIYPNPNLTQTTWIPGVEDFDPDVEWNYYLKDQIKFSFGTYGVNYVTGSGHEARMRGAEPDYFMALQPKIDSGNDPIVPIPDGMLTRLAVTEPNTDDPEVDYNMLYYSSNHLFTYSSLYENMFADDDTTRIGWKALIAFDANDLLVALDENDNPLDTPLTLPAQDEIKYIPFMIEFVDKDGGDSGNWWEISSHTFRAPTGLGEVDMFDSNDNLIGQGVAAMAGLNVSTSAEYVAETPSSFKLDQNYPNPFNPATNISFTLPKASNVMLSVYNVLGQKVATIIDNQAYQAGSHRVRFDASALSSGLYIYKIEAGSFVNAKKMMLIK